MTPSSNLALPLTPPDEPFAHDSGGLPSGSELEAVNEDIAAIDSELSAASHLVLNLRDRRENLLARRAEILLRRDRAGLFETGELVRFFDIEHVGPVEGNEGQ